MKTSDRPQGHLLTDIDGVPARLVRALGERWVTTAEDVLALTATAEGRLGLEQLCAGEGAPVGELLAVLRATVGESEAQRLATAPAEHHTGLLVPPRPSKPGSTQE